MVAKGKIPEEIFDFLNRTTGRSLLLRGLAGTGKTTLALEIMDKMRRLMNTYYLTSRVADSALYDHFPWLKQMIDEGEMMKVVKEMEKLALKREAEKKGQKVERAELRKLEGYIEGSDEAFVEQGEITLAIGSPLEELDLVYDVVEKALPKQTLVVIDSVEGICEKYGVSPAKLIYTLEKDLVESANAKVVLVVETPEKMLDYLVDGVVHLDMDIVNNRTVRKMEIRKLRGLRIRRSQYMYSLEGGRFTALAPAEPEDLMKFNGFEEYIARPFSTGLESADRVIEELGTKGVMLNLFADETITAVDQYLFLKRIIASHLLADKGVFYMPSKMLDIRDIIKYFRCTKECEERFNARLRLLMVHTFLPSVTERLENLMLLEGTNLERELSLDILKEWMGIEPPYLFVIDADTLFSIYPNMGAVGLMSFIRLIRQSGSNCIFITYKGPTNEAISQLSDINLTLRKINAVPVIAGEFPHTPYHGFSVEKYVTSPKSGSKPTQKGIKIKLLPIV